MSFARAAVAAAALALTAAGVRAAESQLLEFQSVYSSILLRIENDFVTFQHTHRGARMAVVDLEDPARQVLAYSPYLFAGELARPDPARILNVGLGGGVFNNAAVVLYPDAQITTVEIDPVFLDLAAEYAGFVETERNTVEISDGRRWIDRNEETWDWIILDAYNKDVQIPFHLTTVEFHQLVSDHLTPGGVAVANLHSTNERLYERLVATISEVYPSVRIFPVPGAGNVIAVMSNLDEDGFDARLDMEVDLDLALAAEPLNIDFDEIREQVETPRVNPRTRLLTDDFAPVEFLQAR